MNKQILKSITAALVLTLGAGLAQAADNNQDVYLRVADANTVLSKGIAKLAAANTATSAPGACLVGQQGYACSAVAQLDQAHAFGLGALFHVDGIESGPSTAARGRRLDRVAWTADANRELFRGIIDPELAGIISPEFAGIISPEYAGIISPEHSADIEELAGIIDPELAGIIDPELTADLAATIAPGYVGISWAERQTIQDDLHAIIQRAEADLVLAHAMSRALDGQY